MRFKTLESYRIGGVGNDMQLSIPVPKTPDGRIYRYSPNENAHPRHFLLGDRVAQFGIPDALTPRMTHMPGTPGTICPYSGVLDEDNAFTHPDDVAAVRDIVAHAAAADVADAFHGMFADLARKNSGNNFVQFKTGPKPQSKPKPRFARRDLLRELVCDECGRDYGVYAISLFCPDCGAPNIHLHFAREVALVREQVELAEKLNAEQGELAYRLLGNAHEDVLTAFEATLKTVYLYKVTPPLAGAPEIKPVGNEFQNIARGQRRFAEFDFDPYGGLSADAIAVLTLNIQKRHVIGHNLGIADMAFAEHAAEARLGETVPLVGEDILQFAHICKMTVNYIDSWLANGVPPPNHDTQSVKPIVAPAVKKPAELKIGQLRQLAVRIGLWASEQSEKGLEDFISEDDLQKAFQESTIDDLAFAVAELAKDGYLRTSAVIARRIPLVRVAAELFITFDPHTVKTDPASDVVMLVDTALTKRNTVGVEELHEATAWPLRRFNPPFAYLISQIDERRILAGGANDYPARGFFLMDEDRVALKRFADRLRL
jgi:hypothetical protein